jgi:hypothetical protein
VSLKVQLSAILAAAVLAAASGSPAAAAVKLIDFTVNGGGWTHVNGVNSPYGLSQQPTLSGTLTFDDTKTGADAFLDLSYATGTRAWTLADIQAGSGVFYSGGAFEAFVLYLGGANLLGSNNAAGIYEGSNGIYCNGCVGINSISAVPEPGTWALMIGGFGLAGAALRRRRPALAA